MHKILRLFSTILLVFIAGKAFAKHVIIDNQLENNYIVIKELYAFGVTSEIVANPLIISPHVKQSPYVVRIPAGDNYLYMLKVSVTKDPSDVANAISICKVTFSPSANIWLSSTSSPFNCDEDMSIYNPAPEGSTQIDPENLPLTIVVSKKTSGDQNMTAKTGE